MTIFAGALTGLFEVIVFLVVVGIAAINKILAARKEQEPPPPRRAQRRPLQQAQANPNPMESRDVDQFLDEVLGRRAAARPRGAPPEQPVVVLRPMRPPPVSPPRNRPEVPRPIVRPAVPRPARQARVPVAAPPETRTRGKFSESVQKDVDEAAAATHQAAALANTGTQAETMRRHATINDVLAMLRSPADIRRAIIIREILGPPVALRRRSS